MSKKILPHLAMGTLFYLLLVIVFGAYVRATGSGAGCGSHWPLCNGEFIPRDASLERLIEWTHRLTSGLSLPLALYLVFSAYKSQNKRCIFYSWWTLFFLLTEALLGAGLVLFEHVAQNRSSYRGLSMGLHLINTFLLTGSAALLVYQSQSPVFALKKIPPSYYWGALGLILVSITGAITALGDTLFPPQIPGEAWLMGLDPTTHIFIQLRIYHPILAVGIAGYLIFTIKKLATPHNKLTPLALLLTVLILSQIGLGYLNIELMAPIWLQLTHLLLAQGIWICYVWFGAHYKNHSSLLQTL
jgi:cytochrome c oxidase assembly protein subunit 15